MTTVPRKFPTAPDPLAAFSLVEITLALGIISFALVSVMALMPLGMKNLRSAIDTTVSAQITQSLVAETQQAKFSELRDLHPQLR